MGAGSTCVFLIGVCITQQKKTILERGGWDPARRCEIPGRVAWGVDGGERVLVVVFVGVEYPFTLINIIVGNIFVVVFFHTG